MVDVYDVYVVRSDGVMVGPFYCINIYIIYIYISINSLCVRGCIAIHFSQKAMHTLSQFVPYAVLAGEVGDPRVAGRYSAYCFINLWSSHFPSLQPRCPVSMDVK